MYMAFELLSDMDTEKTNYPREIAETALAPPLKYSRSSIRSSDLLEKQAEMMEAWAQFISSSDTDVVQIRA